MVYVHTFAVEPPQNQQILSLTWGEEDGLHGTSDWYVDVTRPGIVLFAVGGRNVWYARASNCPRDPDDPRPCAISPPWYADPALPEPTRALGLLAGAALICALSRRK